MSNIKIRRKLLKKIGQINTPITVPAPAAVAPPTDFQASFIFTNISSQFNPSSVILLNKLVSMLHSSLHYTTAGKINFQILKNNNFTLDASSASSPDQKNLIKFSQKIYKDLLNNPSKVLTPTQINDIINILIVSPELNNLSSINPAGPIGQKISNNLKVDIINILNKLKLANLVPTT